MYQMRCTRPEVEAMCRRLSCVHPTVCKLLGADHGPTRQLLKKVRETRGVKSVRVASGIRMDLARFDDEYLEEMARHHVGGHLKVAPEHVSEKVLDLMKKPAAHTFDEFADKFHAASQRAGKEQYLVPYFIASHPGSGVDEMIELAVFLKQRGYKPRQVQDFIPAPMDIATCMYYTGLDPMTMKPVETVTKLKDREVQRALMQFFKPENYFVVRKALIEAGRKDLIGDGPLSPDPEQAAEGSATGATQRRQPRTRRPHLRARSGCWRELARRRHGAQARRRAASQVTAGSPGSEGSRHLVGSHWLAGLQAHVATVPARSSSSERESATWRRTARSAD